MPLKDKYFISVHFSVFILITQIQVIYILPSMSSLILYNNALLLLKKSLKSFKVAKNYVVSQNRLANNKTPPQ